MPPCPAFHTGSGNKTWVLKLARQILSYLSLTPFSLKSLNHNLYPSLVKDHNSVGSLLSYGRNRVLGFWGLWAFPGSQIPSNIEIVTIISLFLLVYFFWVTLTWFLVVLNASSQHSLGAPVTAHFILSYLEIGFSKLLLAAGDHYRKSLVKMQRPTHCGMPSPNWYTHSTIPASKAQGTLCTRGWKERRRPDSFCDEHHGQKQLGEERVYFYLTAYSPSQRNRNSILEPGDRNWYRGHGGWLLTCSGSMTCLTLKNFL